MDFLFLAYIGGFWLLCQVLSFIWKFTMSYIVSLFGTPKELKKYGEWAVVTGCTDGIGKEYAVQLAEKGFSVVLISRTQSKLDELANEIKEKYNVKTHTIAYDFRNIDGFESIEKELNSLDIGVLVNNVGMLSIDPLIECKAEDHFAVMHVNMFSLVGMIHAVVKGMHKRKRGLIINISSVVSAMSLPRLMVYAGTKVFMNTFIEGLSYEHHETIDYQVVTPGYVATKLSKANPLFLFVPTTKEYVRSALRTIGYAEATCGYWVHEILFAFMRMTPKFCYKYHFTKHRN